MFVLLLLGWWLNYFHGFAESIPLWEKSTQKVCREIMSTAIDGWIFFCITSDNFYVTLLDVIMVKYYENRKFVAKRESPLHTMKCRYSPQLISHFANKKQLWSVSVSGDHLSLEVLGKVFRGSIRVKSAAANRHSWTFLQHLIWPCYNLLSVSLNERTDNGFLMCTRLWLNLAIGYHKC